MAEVVSLWREPLSWFGLRGPIAQKPYFVIGVALASLKYATEFVVVYAYGGRLFTPMDFVNPWLNSKAPFLQESPGLGIVWLVFTVPFVWVALTLSTRRAADAGLSPWIGLLVIIPLLNVLVMLALAAIPTGVFIRSAEDRQARAESDRLLQEAYAPPTGVTASVAKGETLRFYRRLLLGVLAGCATQVVTGATSVWIFESYGFVLFFSSPIIAGAAAGFAYSGGYQRLARQLTGMTLIMNVFSFFAMLLVGLDGAVCLVMAFPLLCPLSILGALLGAAIATSNLRPGKNERDGLFGVMLLLPLCLVLESFDSTKPIHQVTTTIQIAAPPEVVWRHVIAFPEITEEMPWLFRLGIASPMRARIEGHGVGAVRHCEFTTGSFVEPIRVWDPPRKLAFDVTSQPYPMEEWTPIPHLHPPHLEDGMRSLRGEFLLEPTGDGGTRLSGTTWYQLDVRPRLYWKCWADPVLHAIHRRVLCHIGDVATSNAN